MARADRPAPFAALVWPLASLRLESPFSGMSLLPFARCAGRPRGGGGPVPVSAGACPVGRWRVPEGVRRPAVPAKKRASTRDHDSTPGRWSAVGACSRRARASARVRDQSRQATSAAAPATEVVTFYDGATHHSRRGLLCTATCRKDFPSRTEKLLDLRYPCIIMDSAPVSGTTPVACAFGVRMRREGRVPAVERRRTCGSSP